MVLQRDLYWCQACNRRWANTVHHKIPRTERPDLALHPDNLEAICAACHAGEHPEKGEKTRKHPARKQPDHHGIRIEKV